MNGTRHDSTRKRRSIVWVTQSTLNVEHRGRPQVRCGAWRIRSRKTAKYKRAIGGVGESWEQRCFGDVAHSTLAGYRISGRSVVTLVTLMKVGLWSTGLGPPGCLCTTSSPVQDKSLRGRQSSKKSKDKSKPRSMISQLQL